MSAVAVYYCLIMGRPELQKKHNVHMKSRLEEAMPAYIYNRYDVRKLHKSSCKLAVNEKLVGRVNLRCEDLILETKHFSISG